ncbi:MAG: YeeE/YedE family protein [Bacteroidales bacterium]|nr:YeeE/YedE family protein [Bacteroidales bacterium]
MEGKRKYMNSYLAGVLLGLLILASFYFTREGLGASGAFKRTAAKIEQTIIPSYIENPDTYFHKYVKNGTDPLKNRLVFMIIGVFVGGFISGAINGRLKVKLQHSPNITAKKRVIAAGIGGILFGIGASFGRGCTSGAGLDGMAVLATTGFIVVAAIFGTGYLAAWFFRKMWL